jgi:hypothetical protein
MTPQETLEVFVVYQNPSDFPPGTFVVRRRVVGRDRDEADKEPFVVAQSLDAARVCLQVRRPGLTNIGRYPEDDPVIAEVWI